MTDPLPHKIIFSYEYERQIKEIQQYIGEYWLSPASAEEFFWLLDRKIELLRSGFGNFSEYHMNPRFRSFSVWEYIILYRVDEKSNVVYLEYIFHASRNVSELI